MRTLYQKLWSDPFIQDVMHWVGEGGHAFGWTEFHSGHERIKHTEEISKQLIKDFQQFVRDHAKPCGECRKTYLTTN